MSVDEKVSMVKSSSLKPEGERREDATEDVRASEGKGERTEHRTKAGDLFHGPEGGRGTAGADTKEANTKSSSTP